MVDLAVSGGLFTNLMSHARAMARSHRAAALGVRLIDHVRYPDARERIRVLEAADRLVAAVRASAALADGSSDLLVDRNGTWVLRNDCWFAVENATWDLLTRPFEADEFAQMAQWMNPGAVMIDVGANFGFHSVALANRYPDAIVHAFEPVPPAAALLRRNSLRNGTAGVRVHEVAVTSATGLASVTTEFSTGNYVMVGSRRLVSPHTLTVPATTLDDFWEAEGCFRLRLVKIDVEGGERDVLRGAERMLREAKPYLVVELVPEWLRRSGSSPDECRDLIASAGYRRARSITEAGWSDLAHLRLDRPGNYLFRADE